MAIIVIAIGYGSIVYGFRRRAPDAYNTFRVRLGRALALALEVLVAADVVRTVALQPTIGNVAVLAILVLIRTFWSWSLVVEVEGRWPWRQRPLGEKA